MPPLWALGGDWELLGLLAHAPSPDSSLLGASREDLILPKGNLVAISKLCLAKLRMRNETAVYNLPD